MPIVWMDKDILPHFGEAVKLARRFLSLSRDPIFDPLRILEDTLGQYASEFLTLDPQEDT